LVAPARALAPGDGEQGEQHTQYMILPGHENGYIFLASAGRLRYLVLCKLGTKAFLIVVQ
jgi:hypothetical protein